jgi:hypothetical protein
MPEAQLSAEAAGALAHRPQTNACPSWRLTMAVITKQQSKTVRTSAQVQLNAAGLRMASHIGQRFLHQSIEMKLVLYGQNRNWSSELEPALDSQRALPLLDKLLDGLFQRKVVEHHRIEIAHQYAKAVL